MTTEDTALIMVKKILVSKPLTRSVLEKSFRRAHRTGAWRRMNPLKRSLLYVAKKTVDIVKSKILESILEEIILEIELTTLRGRALYYGIIIALRKTFNLGKNILEDLKTLLYLGISYLSNPPIYRILD